MNSPLFPESPRTCETDAPFLYRTVTCLALTDGKLPPSPESEGVLSLLFLTGGFAQLRFSDRTVAAAAHTVTILNDGTGQFPQTTETAWTGILLTVSGGASAAFIESLGPCDALPVGNTPFPNAMEDVVRLSHGEIPGSDILLSNAIHHLLSLILTASRRFQKADTASQALVRNSALYIETHLTEPLSLEQMSIRLGISKFYLSRLFSARTGMTLSEYHASCRIRESKRLLGDPFLSISTISNRVGFVDISHFTKCFQKREGLTPSQYRKTLFQ